MTDIDALDHLFNLSRHLKAYNAALYRCSGNGPIMLFHLHKSRRGSHSKLLTPQFGRSIHPCSGGSADLNQTIIYVDWSCVRALTPSAIIRALFLAFGRSEQNSILKRSLS